MMSWTELRSRLGQKPREGAEADGRTAPAADMLNNRSVLIRRRSSRSRRPIVIAVLAYAVGLRPASHAMLRRNSS
jgi:hypothetical protein